MKTKILEALRAKFEGVSDLYLEGIASSLARRTKDADAIESAIEGVTLDKLFEHYGDTRATHAASKAEERTLRRLQPQGQPQADGQAIKDGQQTAQERADEPTEGAALTLDAVKSLIQEAVQQSTEALQRQIGQFATQGIKREREEAFNQVLNGCKDETIRRMKARDFGRLSFENTEEFDAYLTELRQDVETINKQTAQGSLLGMHRPAQGDGATVGELSPDVIKQVAGTL